MKFPQLAASHYGSGEKFFPTLFLISRREKRLYLLEPAISPIHKLHLGKHFGKPKSIISRITRIIFHENVPFSNVKMYLRRRLLQIELNVLHQVVWWVRDSRYIFTLARNRLIAFRIGEMGDAIFII